MTVLSSFINVAGELQWKIQLLLASIWRQVKIHTTITQKTCMKKKHILVRAPNLLF